MVEINEQNHVSSLISSIHRSFNLLKIKAEFNFEDIYLNNIIFKLLNNCCLNLNNEERVMLNKMYRDVYFGSDQICESNYIKPYEVNPIVKFEQADSSDCNTYDPFPKIYFWQDDVLTNTITEIEPMCLENNFFIDKEFDSYENFELGRNINYSKIGKICFCAFNSMSLNFTIKNVLDVDITDQFRMSIIPQEKAVLIVSKNNMSHGEIKIKIKKN